MATKILLKIFITGILGIFVFQFPLAQNKLTKLGLVSELAYIKMSAENHLSEFIDSSSIIASEKKELLKKYLELRTAYDQIILQLISDNNKKNHIKYFKKTDRVFYRKSIEEIDEGNYRKKVRRYISALKSANRLYKEFINFIPKDNPKEKSTAQDALGAFTFVSSTIKDIREARSKKVEAINLLLNDLRLSPIQELGKPKEDKEKKEK